MDLEFLRERVRRDEVIREPARWDDDWGKEAAGEMCVQLITKPDAELRAKGWPSTKFEAEVRPSARISRNEIELSASVGQACAKLGAACARHFRGAFLSSMR